MQAKKIEAYGLAEYSAAVQQAIQEGYVFDFDTNENTPVSYGGYFTAVLLKVADQEVQPVQPVQKRKSKQE